MFDHAYFKLNLTMVQIITNELWALSMEPINTSSSFSGEDPRYKYELQLNLSEGSHCHDTYM